MYCVFLTPKLEQRKGVLSLALSTANLKKVVEMSEEEESHIKKQLILSGGLHNWRMVFTKFNITF